MVGKRYKFSRYGMYTKIENTLKQIRLNSGKCLVIGDTLNGKGANPALFNMLPKGTTAISPDYPAVDIQKLSYDDDSFDYVLADQVIEHVRKPWVGVEEVRRVLKPGGITVLTSALMFYIHGVPYDYWRFTPAGLRILCEKFSKIHVSEGNGNREFVAEVCLGAGPGGVVKPGSPIEKRAMVCDNKHLVTVWIIAEK